VAKKKNDELEFRIIDKIVDQGEKRLKSMFRETLDDLEKQRTQQLTAMQKRELEQVITAYQLARDLVLTLVDVKDNIQIRLGH
jgi:hypothetical protein